MERLAERVVSGGVVLIVDFVLEEDGEDGGKKRWIPSAADRTVRAHGFSEEGMRGLFERAGLTEVGYRVMDGTVTLRMGEGEGIERRVFLGRGTKP